MFEKTFQPGYVIDQQEVPIFTPSIGRTKPTVDLKTNLNLVGVLQKLKNIELPELSIVGLLDTQVKSNRLCEVGIRDPVSQIQGCCEHKVDPPREIEIIGHVSGWWISQSSHFHITTSQIESLYPPGSTDYGHHLGAYVEQHIYPRILDKCPELATRIIECVRCNASYYVASFLWRSLKPQIEAAYIQCHHERRNWLQTVESNCRIWSETYHPYVEKIFKAIVHQQVDGIKVPSVARSTHRSSQDDALLLPYRRNSEFTSQSDDRAHNLPTLHTIDPIRWSHLVGQLQLYLKLQILGPQSGIIVAPDFDPAPVIQHLLYRQASRSEIASHYQVVKSKPQAVDLDRFQAGTCLNCSSAPCSQPSATLSYWHGKIYFRCWAAPTPHLLLDLNSKLSTAEKAIAKQYRQHNLRQSLREEAQTEWNSYKEARKYCEVPDYNLTPSIIAIKERWRRIHCSDPDFTSKFLQESEFHTDHPILAIHSGMNTGKTEQLIRYIKRLLLEGLITRFIYVSPRCSFANSVCQRLVEAGIPIKNYLDCDHQNRINDHDFVMISTESMYKAASRDLVIIDEVDTVLFQMLSPHHRDHLKTNQKVFETHIKEAKRLIILDANITSTALRFLQKLRPRDSIELVRNGYRPRQGWQAGLYQEAAWLLHLKQAIARRENVAIVTSSESYGETKLLTMLLDRKNGCGLSREQIGWYHGSGDDLKEELKNVNSTWIRYRVVMFTSTINVGIDFNVPHFHSLFVYGNNQSVCVEEIRQMMGRIRSTQRNNNRIYCFIRDNRGQYILNKEEIKAFIVKVHELADQDTSLDHYITYSVQDPDVDVSNSSIHRTTRKNLLSTLRHATTVEVAYKHGFTLEDTCWNDLAVEYLVRINRSKAQYTERFINMLEDQGIEVTDHRNFESTEEQKAIGYKVQMLANDARDDRQGYFTRLAREPEPTPEIREEVEQRIKNGEARGIDHDHLLVWRWKSRILPEYHSQIVGSMIDGPQRLTPHQLSRLQILKSQNLRIGWHSYWRQAERSTIVTLHDELILKANRAVCKILEVSSLTHYDQKELDTLRAGKWDSRQIDPEKASLGEMETQLEYLRFEREGWPTVEQFSVVDHPKCRRSFLYFEHRVVKDKLKEWIDLYTLLNGSADLGLSAPKTLDRVTGLVKAWFIAVYGFQWQQTATKPRINGEQNQRVYKYLCRGSVFQIYNWLRPTNLHCELPQIHLAAEIPNL